MATPDHPFLAIKARLVVLVFFCHGYWSLSGVWYPGVPLDLIPPLQPDDPIVAPMLSSLTFGGVCLAVIVRMKRPLLQLRQLLGRWPQQLHWGSLLFLIFSVFLFSLGAFQLSYLALSLFAPALVESTLQQSLTLAADETTYPTLYSAVTVGSVLLVAPGDRGIYFSRHFAAPLGGAVGDSARPGADFHSVWGPAF